MINNLGEDIPGLLIIDGGRGHLSAARTAIGRTTASLKKPVEIAAIAKDPDRAFLMQTDEPVDLEDRSRASLLLKSIRDEAHRFAVDYHRKLRSRQLLTSPLEDIDGIGKKRRLELLRVFGSIENIRNADIKDIIKIKGFHRKLAQKILTDIGRHA
jgi:excinuclease ABC subunit C